MAKRASNRKKDDPRLLPRPGQLVVRMYRQGLGDCFLLAFGSAKPKGVRYLLIDCGVHKRQDSGTDRLREVLEEVVAATGGHLHVVVATHEHADHLSGFVQKGSPFLSGELAVDALWVAWTEKVGDQEADTFRSKRGTARSVIEKAVKEAEKAFKEAEQRNAAPGLVDTLKGLVDTLKGLNDFEDPAEDSVDWEEAFKLIRKRWNSNPDHEAAPPEVTQFLRAQAGDGSDGLAVAGKRRKKPSANELALGVLAALARHVEYVSPGDVLNLPGVGRGRCFVLGPPRDPRFLAKSRPTKIGRRAPGGGKESEDGVYQEVYLSGRGEGYTFRLAPALDGDTPSAKPPPEVPDYLRYPFDGFHRRLFRTTTRDGKSAAAELEWVNDPEEVPKPTQEFFRKYYLRTGDADPQAWRRIDTDWLGTAGALALDLGNDTNNTSLVLALEWGKPGEGRILLFPGDAQVGNWLSWRRQSYQVGRRTLSVDDLLKRTLLYKVGHHASHNGTVRRDPGEATAEYPLGVPFGLELMDNIIALIPVNRDAAKKKAPVPWDMPYAPLYTKLRVKARRRVLRSDDSMSPLPDTDKDLVPTQETWAATPGLRGVQWRRSKKAFTAAPQSALYYDILIGSASS